MHGHMNVYAVCCYFVYFNLIWILLLILWHLQYSFPFVVVVAMIYYSIVESKKIEEGL